MIPSNISKQKAHKTDDMAQAAADPSITRQSFETDLGDDCSDEYIEAVREETRKDITIVRAWWLVVVFMLFLTAAVATGITYKFLDDEQEETFNTAFEKITESVEYAIVDQQHDLRTAYRGLAESITMHLQTAETSTPNTTVPFFRKQADTALKTANTETSFYMHGVTNEQRAMWEEYSTRNHEAMVKEAHMLENGHLRDLNATGFHATISKKSNGDFVADDQRDMYYPLFESAPAPSSYDLINWNLLGEPAVSRFVEPITEFKDQVIFAQTQPYGAEGSAGLTEVHRGDEHAQLDVHSEEAPRSFFFTSVQSRLNDPDSPMVGVLGGTMSWGTALSAALPVDAEGIVVVLRNTCNQNHTFASNDKGLIFEGKGDSHDLQYDKFEVVIDLNLPSNVEYSRSDKDCKYSLSIYPTREFEDVYRTFTPETFAIIMVAIFLFIAAVFVVYDMLVSRRNQRLVENAARSNAIVTSLFPGTMKHRLIQRNQGDGKFAEKRMSNLKNYLNGNMERPTSMDKKPLADLFLETTILFADIAGFTAWSSVREPSQVFTLLETVFSSFDHVAKIRRVFKVETVGDCYVAASGIPEARADHAVAMVRFARDILIRMQTLTKELEVTHGPDTADLSVRVGIHSGPVTAGVLRGERARFQLFGDTMNTASRIEHTGEVGRIQVSTDTAECLTLQGKSHWLIKRKDMVEAKGKGLMQTYWIKMGLDDEHHVDPSGEISHHMLTNTPAMDGAGNMQKSTTNLNSTISQVNANANTSANERTDLDERNLRLVDWNVQMLLQIIRQIIARRDAVREHAKKRAKHNKNLPRPYTFHHLLPKSKSSPLTPFDEVKEIICLPEFSREAARLQKDPEDVKIDPVIEEQLRLFITTIASMYGGHPFHNFEHASHVTMSVMKLLTRIVAPTDLEELDDMANPVTQAADTGNEKDDRQFVAATLHDHTYGITSDPLTQFACGFAALTHDVDHPGVPNAQLVKENTMMAQLYDSKSVAEQNSMVLSWEIFMCDEFNELRSCICSTATELDRFRQLVVNAVMATDIVDKELKELRNNRWDKAFNEEETIETHSMHIESTNRKATIVIEHLIQASDVAHTMQHWHVYRKWNSRFFGECYAAYQQGRSETNPVDNWYRGELGFFDFYIIPLAKKLKECGVFGKSSDEYLNYARANRQEWERRGEEIVAEMLRNYQRGITHP